MNIFFKSQRSLIRLVVLALILNPLIFAAQCSGGPTENLPPVTEAEPGEAIYALGTLRGQAAADFDFLKPAAYLRTKRQVEMYAYIAKSAEDRCDQEWTATPDLDIASHPVCSDKINRRSYVPNREGRADLTIVVDGKEYALAGNWETRELPEYKVQPEDIVENQRLRQHKEFFYFNQYCTEDPRAECERVRFTTIRFDPAAQYVVVGALRADGQSIGPYKAEDGTEYFYIAPASHKDVVAK